MIATEIEQLEERLSHTSTFVDRQPLLKRLWKLRREQLVGGTTRVPTLGTNESHGYVDSPLPPNAR